MIEAPSALDRKCVFSRPNLAIGLGKVIAFASRRLIQPPWPSDHSLAQAVSIVRDRLDR
jgi:hypothetical protein